MFSHFCLSGNLDILRSTMRDRARMVIPMRSRTRQPFPLDHVVRHSLAAASATVVLMLGCTNARPLEAAAPVHTAGFMDPTQPDFHGTLLLKSNFDFGLCQECHGQDFSGGKAGVSCLSCHKGSGGIQPGVMNSDGTPACAPATPPHQPRQAQDPCRRWPAGQAVRLYDLPS